MTEPPRSTAEAAALWAMHMRRGAFDAAWSLNDAMRRARMVSHRADIPRHFQTIWDGEPVDGRRVLVRCYHGLGDTIQFIRYVPLLRPRVAQLLLWVQPALLPLLSKGIAGVDAFLPLHDGDPGIPHDATMEIMELPYLFRTNLSSIPHQVPYLDVPVARLDRSHGPAIGLVWRAGDWARHRSIPFDALSPLTSAAVTWYVLQGSDGLQDRPEGFGTLAGTDDILEAARTIAALDLLITIDSMPAHLAGALGTSVWTLLPAEADWRWMEGRDDNPWYPTMRLFRQERSGEWGPVIERVAAALGAFVEGAREASQPTLTTRIADGSNAARDC